MSKINLTELEAHSSTVNVLRRDGSKDRVLVTRVQADRFVVQGGQVFGADGEPLCKGSGVRADRVGISRS